MARLRTDIANLRAQLGEEVVAFDPSSVTTVSPPAPVRLGLGEEVARRAPCPQRGGGGGASARLLAAAWPVLPRSLLAQ